MILEAIQNVKLSVLSQRQIFDRILLERGLSNLKGGIKKGYLRRLGRRFDSHARLFPGGCFLLTDMGGVVHLVLF